MRTLFFFWLLFSTHLNLYGQQQPQYILQPISSHSISNVHSSVLPISTRSTDMHLQNLHYPFEFPGMPKGYITKIYMMRSVHTADFPICNIIYPNTFIGMAQYRVETGQDEMNLPPMHTPAPTPWIVTDTVFFESNHMSTNPLDSGDWVGFTLQKPFFYDTAYNFIVDLSSLAYKVEQPNPNTICNTGYYFAAVAYSQTYHGRSYVGLSSPANRAAFVQSNQASPVVYIGFDVTPLSTVWGAEAPATISVYPNPASDKLHLRFTASSPSGTVQLQLTNVVGQLVYSATERLTNREYSGVVDVSSYPGGVYLLSVVCGNSKLVRKVVVE